ncbi:MAG: carbonic anhydrase [Sulfurovaceae bacterium]|nr:carbonic anhydrase [Sulfurovaceae bacterium]
MGKKNINALIRGHHNFQDLNFKKNEERFKSLVHEGQNPKALFIGCSDSRVVPELITGSKPGDLFIVRNIGNFVAPFKPDEDYHATASAIEYAVGILGISDIIICGHSHCGAIGALYSDVAYSEDILHTVKWLELGNPAKEYALSLFPNVPKEQLLRYTEKISVLFQLENILTYPMVKKRVDERSLFLHGWYYDITTGVISSYDDESDSFIPLEL